MGKLGPPYITVLNGLDTFAKQFNRKSSIRIGNGELTNTLEFFLSQQAMNVVGFDSDTQMTILKLVSAILHLGNIQFKEESNVAVPVSDNSK